MQLLAMKERVQHGEAALPLRVYRSQLQAGGAEVSYHWHEEMEIVLIHAGCGESQIDLDEYHVTAGDILIIQKGQLHSLKATSAELVMDACVFQLGFLKSAMHDQCQLEYIAPILRGNVDFQTQLKRGQRGYEQLAQAVQALMQCYHEREIAYELELKSQLYRVLVLLYRHGWTKTHQQLPKVKQKKLATMKEVLQYIEVNHPYPMNIKALAKVANYSEFHFLRFFQQEVGVKCSAYIVNVRLEHAHQTLVESELAVTEVALQHGFENVSYFIKKFKEKYGQTPHKYRQMQSQTAKRPENLV